MIQEDLPQEIINQAEAATAQILPEKSRGVFVMTEPISSSGGTASGGIQGFTISESTKKFI